MPLDTLPHTLTIPPELFRRIQEVAAARGREPDQFVLETLTATVAEPVSPVTYAQSRAKLAAGFAASGMTEDELDDYAVQAVRQVRMERHSSEAQP